MDETWQVAPTGELRKYAAKAQGRILRRQVLVYGSSGIACGILGMATYKFLRPEIDQGAFIANIYCSDVQKNLKAYHQQQLTSELQTNIKQHLAACEHCQAYDHEHFG